jgi:putative nucleotidyltransferase with HDIG domain
MPRTSSRSAALLAGSLAEHVFKERVDSSKPIADAQARDLDELVSEQLVDDGAFAMKIWSVEGRLLYSSDHETTVGELLANDNVVRASAGELVNRVSMSPEEGRDDFEQHRRYGENGLLEVYVPVEVADQEVPLILELYQSYEPVAASIRTVNAAVWGLVVLGAGLAYLLQVGFVRHAADQIVSARGEVNEVTERLQHSMRRMEADSVGTLQALTSAVDAKDGYTARHSVSVTDYALAIGRRLGLSEADLIDLERAGLLHDLGKIGTPEAVLLKPSSLNDEELEIIREHSEMSAKIAAAVPSLAGAVPAILHHHERWDGRGYPTGLAGEEIPRLARILAVADSFDAMTSDRPYRSGMSIEQAREELGREVGTQFDGQAVDALIEAIDAGEIVSSYAQHAPTLTFSQEDSGEERFA